MTPTSESKKFFLPAASGPEQAEQVYAQIRKFVAEQSGYALTDRCIETLGFRDKGKISYATVGGLYDHDLVCAIFESSLLYYVCTENRGVVHGGPYLVGKDEVILVKDFAAA